MTNIEHMMLSVCFGMNVGWMLGGLMIIITDGIKLLKEKHNAKRNRMSMMTKKGQVTIYDNGNGKHIY